MGNSQPTFTKSKLLKIKHRDEFERESIGARLLQNKIRKAVAKKLGFESMEELLDNILGVRFCPKIGKLSKLETIPNKLETIPIKDTNIRKKDYSIGDAKFKDNQI